MKIRQLIITLSLTIFLFACAKVPLTGRKQFNLLPESQMIGMSSVAYVDFLKENKVAPIKDSDSRMVKKVGQKIANAVEQYLRENHESKRVEGFNWEFNLVEDPSVNAWCMPGGKVVVYTGILPITQDEAGLAVVMGHEIAHAIARHGNERMSTNILAQVGLTTLNAVLEQKPQLANDMILTAAGVGTQLGLLKFSRNHESEADKMGLVFMAMAGYNPETAPKFWERMSAAGGEAPPQFLSTHPSHETRIQDLNDYMDEAKKYYHPSASSAKKTKHVKKKK